MGDFLKPEYFTAVGQAVGNGFCVLIGMIIVASIYTFISGGPAAKNWPKADHGQGH